MLMKGERQKDHGTRKLINNYVVEHPGVTIKVLSRTLGLNLGTVRYHLENLVREEVLISRKEGGLRRYFSSMVSYSSLTPNARERNISRNQERVLKLIEGNPGITRKEIKNSLDITGKGLTYVLQRLRSSRMIWEVRRVDTIGFEVITREKLMDEILVMLARRLVRGEIDERTYLELKDEIGKKLEEKCSE
jgi:predicted transcriptional regulator